MSEFLGDRKNALEDSFFHQQEETLRQKLRDQQATTAHKEALAQVSSIKDDAVLDHLVSLEIHADTLAALTILPLVEVAWADGRMEDREREAILAAAADHGVIKGAPAWELLQNWLETRPGEDLFEAWTEYIGAVVATLDEQAKAVLKTQLLARAREIAEACGGVFGFGDKVSLSEKTMLERLEAAFG